MVRIRGLELHCVYLATSYLRTKFRKKQSEKRVRSNTCPFAHITERRPLTRGRTAVPVAVQQSLPLGDDT